MKGAVRLSVLAAGLAVFSLMEPRVAFLGPWCALICVGTLAYLSRGGLEWRLLPALVGLFTGTVALTGYNIGADTLNYLGTTASLLQDFDLDHRNQFVEWGLKPPDAGPLGTSINAQPVGPAFVWALPALAGHAYAQVAGIYAKNFASPPYLGAMVAATLVVALSGMLALTRFLQRDLGPASATLAVSSAVLASPVVFYLTLQPLMAHGLTFGFTCWAVVAVARACESDAPGHWRLAGAALGAAMACRFQAAVLLALVPVMAGFRVTALARCSRHLLPPALLLLLPQAFVSATTFGSLFVIPQGGGFMNWMSPHWVDTLLSADRGLFNWHPLLLLGLLGLLIPVRPLHRLAVSGLLVFVLTVWTNGAVRDFNGSDAFGARRYDLVIPFLAIGLGQFLTTAAPVLSKRPLALPALLLTASALWNFSLMSDYGKVHVAAAPLEDVAAAHGRRLQRSVESTFGWIGPRTRFRIYDAFVGLYTYRNYRPGGDFDLATLEPRFLGPGWSPVQGWDDGALFRYVLFPEACIVIPLGEPFDLRGFVLARSPARITEQRIALRLNGQALSEQLLPAAWTEIPFDAPRRFWVAGENTFCIRLARKRPGDAGDDLAYAAAVVKVQLP